MSEASEVEDRAHDVLIQHQRRDIKGCTCGTWGSDHGHMGQSHAAHVIDELRRAGLIVATIRPESTPDAVVRVSTTPDTFGTAERRTRR